MSDKSLIFNDFTIKAILSRLEDLGYRNGVIAQGDSLLGGGKTYYLKFDFDNLPLYCFIPFYRRIDFSFEKYILEPVEMQVFNYEKSFNDKRTYLKFIQIQSSAKICFDRGEDLFFSSISLDDFSKKVSGKYKGVRDFMLVIDNIDFSDLISSEYLNDIT